MEAIHFNTLKNYLLYSNVKTFIGFFSENSGFFSVFAQCLMKLKTLI